MCPTCAPTSDKLFYSTCYRRQIEVEDERDAGRSHRTSSSDASWPSRTSSVADTSRGGRATTACTGVRTARRSQVPSLHQRWYQRQAVVALPYLAGILCHLAPLCRTERIPSIVPRRSVRAPHLPTIAAIAFHGMSLTGTKGAGGNAATGATASTIRSVACSSAWRTTSFARWA